MSAQHRYRPGHTVPAGTVIYCATRTAPEPLPWSRFLHTGRQRVVFHDGPPALPRFSGELPLDDNPRGLPSALPLIPPEGTPAAAGAGEPRPRRRLPRPPAMSWWPVG